MLKILEKLKESRIGISHYLNDKDINVIKQKRVLLLDKIKNMPEEIKELFEHDYPELLENIIDFICVENVEVKQDTITAVNKWFIV
jgi:hypothetical protein